MFSSSLNALLAARLRQQWRRRPASASPLTNAQRILVVELGGLGDAVHVLPVLAALRQPVTVVCRDYAAELFNLVGHTVIGITKSRAGVARAVSELGRTEWDLALSTCWSTWTTALALKLNTKMLCGYWRPWRVEVFGCQADLPAVATDDHLATLRWKAISPMGFAMPASLPVPILPTGGVDPRTAGRIVFVPLCEDSRKSLTDAETKTVLSQLDSPVLFGGQAEARRLEGAVITGSIRTMLSALGSARLVVSVDTGAMHVAAALGVPTIGIFKSTDPRYCGPIGTDVTTLGCDQLSKIQTLARTRTA